MVMDACLLEWIGGWGKKERSVCVSTFTAPLASLPPISIWAPPTFLAFRSPGLRRVEILVRC